MRGYTRAWPSGKRAGVRQALEGLDARIGERARHRAALREERRRKPAAPSELSTAPELRTNAKKFSLTEEEAWSGRC